jgi:hypothetical protein
MTLPAQADVVEDHIADALARGGRAVIGGMQSVQRPYVDPVILADVPETSMAVQDETAGGVRIFLVERGLKLLQILAARCEQGGGQGPREAERRGVEAAHSWARVYSASDPGECALFWRAPSWSPRRTAKDR